MKLNEVLHFSRNLPPIVGRETHGLVANKEIVGEYTYSMERLGDYLRGSSSTQKVHYLADLYVEEKMRGRGLGARLLKQFKRIAPRNIPYMLITDKGSKSYPLYVREGFVDVGISIYGNNSRVLIFKRDRK